MRMIKVCAIVAGFLLCADVYGEAETSIGDFGPFKQ